MNKEEALTFIFSKPEWKAHFIQCAKKLEPTFFCGCCHAEMSFDNINRKVTCAKCNKEVKDWYKELPQEPESLKYAWNENGPVPFTPAVAQNIKDVLRKEEENFEKLIEEKEPLLKSLKDNLNGETLSWLHQTHGLDLDLVEDILSIKLSIEQRDEYKKYYNIHRKTGLAGFTPKIISI